MTADQPIGPYRILSPIGSGGMGEVYRAKDTRLGREVAIKILPADVAGNPDRLRRFEQEARTASALNHPNIVTIYDIGSADSQTYMAMELIDGKTLRATGQLSVPKILNVASQIADGLAKAHAAGIIHRDLKPENIMITKDGFAKILDFGLAKLRPSSTEEFSQIETQTIEGKVLGTLPYMSPEQAAGQSVDFRSDQFSFGTILYEMISGKNPFHRKTAVDTLSAVINHAPPAITNAPPPLVWIIERCLAKDPNDRYESTRDLAKEIQTLRDHLTKTETPIVLSAQPAKRFQKVWNVLAAVLISALLATIFILYKQSRVSSPVSYSRLTYRRGSVFSARFAPDNRTVVYTAAWDGNRPQIYVGSPQNPEFRSIGLSNASVLSISRKGELAILQNCRYDSPDTGLIGTLASVPLSGGAPRQLADNVTSADWTPDGKNLAVIRHTDVYKLEFPLGKVLYEAPGNIICVRVSPTGDSVAFVEMNSSIRVVNSDGKIKTISTGWGYLTGIAWLPSGKEMLFSGSKSISASKELRRVSLSGEENLILPFTQDFRLADLSGDAKVLSTFNSDRAQMNVLSSGSTAERDLSWFDWSRLTDISNDGKLLLFDERGEAIRQTAALTYVRNTDGSDAVRLAEGNAWALSPDAKWAIVGSADPGDSYQTKLMMIPTGVGEARVLERGPIEKYAYANWFPDGKRIAFEGAEKKANWKIYVQDTKGGLPAAIVNEPLSFAGLGGQFSRWISPDGKSLLVGKSDSSYWIYAVDGRPPRPIPGIAVGSYLHGWNGEGDKIYFSESKVPPMNVYLFDLATGRKEFWKQLGPSDPAGVTWLMAVRITPDGKAYAYSYERLLSDLFLIEGFK